MMYLKAFVVGGLICAIVQIFMEKTKIKTPRILVSLVVIGAILTGVELYEPVVEFAGAGATAPLLGFGYALAKGVFKAVDESGLLGVLTGGLTATAGGITAVIVLAYIVSFISKESNDNK
ncbi:MAG: SpoVA protein [Clostridiales bacterium]|jgi:stage V sporulation protein AE|nr:SpoVA protein [Clostridiales bacterium]